MSADLELNDWRAQWQAQVEPRRANAAEIRRNAVRQQRWLRTAQVLELFAGVVFLAASVAVARRGPGMESFLWAAVVWLTTLIVCAFSVWNWRILWKADLKSVAEFAQEYEKRCLAKVRAARFGKGFVVVQAMISVPWLTWDYHRTHLSTATFSQSMLLLIALTGGFWMMFSRYRRAALRELHGIRDVRNAS